MAKIEFGKIKVLQIQKYGKTQVFDRECKKTPGKKAILESFADSRTKAKS